MNNKIKVLFIIPTLFAGGAERVMSFISQNLNKEKFDVTLIVIGFEKDSKYIITGIPVKFLNKKRVLNSIFPLILTLRKDKPQIVVSALAHLNIIMGLISLIFPKIKFIGRHTIVSTVANKYKTGQKYSTRRKIIKFFDFGYKYLDIILCQSMDMYNDVKLNYNLPDKKLKTINNPMTDGFNLKSKNSNNKDVIKFITVARLKKLKGHRRIINAISKLNVPYQYTIIGNGPEKNNLFQLINELGIQDKIEHIPFTNEVSKYLSKSDFYLQGSYAEGFPNCLIESCSVGTPVIAFRATGGLNEIIEDGVNGFLVNDEKEFIEKIDENGIWDPEVIRGSVMKKFSKEKILKQYEDLFQEVLI